MDEKILIDLGLEKKEAFEMDGGMFRLVGTYWVNARAEKAEAELKEALHRESNALALRDKFRQLATARSGYYREEKARRKQLEHELEQAKAAIPPNSPYWSAKETLARMPIIHDPIIHEALEALEDDGDEA